MKFFKIILTILISCSFVFGGYENKAGLQAGSIEQMLQLPEMDIDIATAALLVSKRWKPEINIIYYRNKIEAIADDVYDRLGRQEPTDNPKKTVSIINDILFNEMRFSPVENADNPEDLFLHCVIDNKKGYCLSLSILYLAIAERLEMPIKGVVVPGHFFVRYSDGKQTFNIETTQHGISAPNKHYIEEFKVPPVSSDTAYLKNLNKTETIGCFFNNLANIYFEQNDIDNAFYYQSKAVEINPTLAEARTNLGNIYLKRDQLPAAIEQYKAALAINSNDAKTYHNLANAYSQSKQYPKAIEQYNIAASLDPNYIEIYKGLAQAYQAEEMFQQALDALDKAVKLDSSDSQIYLTFGNIYQDSQDYQQAVSNYKLALALKADNVAAAYGLANVFLKTEDYYGAIEQFKAVIYYEPQNTNANANFGLALAYDRLGWQQQAIEGYVRAVAIDDTFTAAWNNMAQIYMNQEQYIPAIEAYKHILNILQTEKNAETYYNLGVAYSAIEQYEQAEQYYLKAVKIAPEFAAGHNNLAITLYMLQNYTDALSHAQKAKALGFDVSADFLEQLIKLSKN